MKEVPVPKLHFDEFVVQVLLAILVGVLINRVCAIIRKQIRIVGNRYLVAADVFALVIHLQIILSFVFILLRFAPHIVHNWQYSMAGLYFPAIFFSMQGSLWDNINDLMDSIPVFGALSRMAN